MKPHDEARIRKAVRQQIIEALREDLKGGETIMKEAWEECGDTDELHVAKDELGQIIAMIVERQARP